MRSTAGIEPRDPFSSIRLQRGKVVTAAVAGCSITLAPGGQPLQLVSCDLPRPLGVGREPGDPVGLSGTDHSTAATVRRMCAHISDGVADPAVWEWVRAAMRSPGATRNARSAAAAWWWFVKHHVFFREDGDAILALLNEADQLELLIAPSVLVRMRRPEEDCDGFTMLVITGLVILGLPCFICTIAAEPESPRRWSHVYAVASFGDGAPVAFDGSHGEYPGWEVPAERQYRRQLWNMAGEPVGEVSSVARKGLHGYVAANRSLITPTRAELLGWAPPGSAQAARRRMAGRLRGLGFAALPGTVDVAGGSSWSTVLQQLALQGGNIAQQVLAPLRPGEFVQTAEGVRSREVAGAVPDPWASASARGGGASTSIVGSPAVPSWVLIGGAVVGVVLLVAISKRS